ILRVSCDAAELPLQVCSPDGKNLIELAGLGEQTNGLGFKVSRGGRPLIDITSFTVRLAEGVNYPERRRWKILSVARSMKNLRCRGGKRSRQRIGVNARRRT